LSHQQGSVYKPNEMIIQLSLITHIFKDKKKILIMIILFNNLYESIS